MNRLLGALGTILGTTLASIRYPGCIQSSTNRVIAYAGQVFYPTASDQNHGVLLQIVAFTTDV